MARQALDILPPILGVDRQLGYQSQPPYTCAGAMNFWPRDRFEGRMRGGDRPGLVKEFSSAVTGPTHLLANVRVFEVGSFSGDGLYSDNFSPGGWGDQWGVLESWTSNRLMRQDGYAYHPIYADSDIPGQTAGMVLDDLRPDSSYYVKVSMSIFQDLVQDSAGIWQPEDPRDVVYTLWAGLDNDNPNVYEAGVVRLNVNVRFGAEIQIINLFYRSAEGAWVSLGNDHTTFSFSAKTAALWIFPNDTVRGTYGNLFVDGAALTPPGQRVALSIYGLPPEILVRHRVANFKVVYRVPAIEAIRNRNMVVAAGGTNTLNSKLEVRFEKNISEFTAVDSVDASVVNDDGRQLQATELLGHLYIVGEKDQEIWCCSLIDDGAIGTIQEVHDIAGDAFAFTPAPSGTPPDSCTWICAWRNRLVCGGDWDDPQNVFMSKVAVPQDWDYASIPVGSAIKFNTTGIDTGKLGEPVNAGIPTSDDYLVLGCLNSLYVLRGDPTYGGQIDRLSASIGILAPQAWARGPNGETVFLSQDGVYGIAPGVSSYPESISRERLPQELRDIDTLNYRILMAYDVRNRGVFIGITPMFGSGGKYFWLDWEARGFWPMEFNPSFEPTSLVYRNADASIDQRLLFGCRDGHVRALNDNAFTDDGLKYKSELLIGPIALGGGGYSDGMLLEIVGQLGLGSGDITCGVKVGKSIEQAYRAEERSTFTMRAGKNLTSRPRLRANAAFIRLSSDGGTGWATENMTVVREKLGKQRLL